MPVYQPKTTGLSPVFNVKDYGALGDGSDDGAAIQAAVSAANAAGGGTVYFPAGAYIVTASNFNLANSTKGVKLVGQAGYSPGLGPAVILRNTFAPGTNFNAAFAATSSTGLEIRNIQFEVPVATPIWYMLNLTSASDVTIDHCLLTNNVGSQKGYGLLLTSATRVVVSQTYFNQFVRGIDNGASGRTHLTVRDCTFASCATGILFGAVVGAINIQSNTFSTATTAIDFGSNTSAHTGLVTANSFTSVTTKYANQIVSGDLVVIDGQLPSTAPVFNVKDYGAKGDNSTDDSTAINAALAAANNAGGGTVFFPRGTYVMASQLTMGSKTNVRLQGVSTSVEQSGTVSGVTIKSTLAGASVTCFNFSSCHAVTVQGIRFQATGLSAQTTTFLADMSSATDLLLSDCTFLNSSASAMFGTVTLTSALRVTIERCWFSNLYQGLNGSSAQFVTVRDTTFSGNSYGFNNAGTYTVISRCQFVTTTAATSHLVIASAYTLVENTLFSATSTMNNPVIINGACCTITGCNFQGTGVSTSTAQLYMSSSAGFRCADNNFNSAATGLAIDLNSGGVTGEIAHNQFTANIGTRYALSTSASYVGLAISDNLHNPLGATHPAIASDTARWYPVVDGQANQSVAGSAGATWAIPFLPARPVTLSKVAVKLTVAGTMSVRAGIYVDNGTGLPALLVADFGLVSANTTGFIQWTTNLPINLASRLCWVVLTPQSVTTNASFEMSTTRSRHVGDSGSVPAGVDGYGAYITAAGQHTGAYPGTFGAISGLNYAPVVYLQLK